VELSDHKYVMVLHDHQANPHVHISARAESRFGKRLNPRKTDLHRWRETFAAKLRERGVEAEATRQATRGAMRRYPSLWKLKATEEGRLRMATAAAGSSSGSKASRDTARAAWREIAAALGTSGSEADRRLGRSIEAFVAGIPDRPLLAPHREQVRRHTPTRSGPTR
jgi:type IV secretory pathway VirD2 relaxase